MQSLIRVPIRLQKKLKTGLGMSQRLLTLSPLYPIVFDVVIATAWNAAEYVAMQPTLTKPYFIQDFEPWFYPMGENYLRAEQSYRLGLMPITIGR